MKFQNYLDEQYMGMTKLYTPTQKTIDELASFLDKNCKQWFKEVGDYYIATTPVHRGVKEHIATFRVKKGTRQKDREPKLTAKPVFEVFDKAFAEEFGWWVRSRGIFTGSSGVTIAYGDAYYFFPIGNYKYVWSHDYRKVWHNLTTPYSWNSMDDEEKQEHLEDEKKIAEKAVKLYSDKNIKRATRMLRDYEAIFQCKQYVLAADTVVEPALKQMFG